MTNQLLHKNPYSFEQIIDNLHGKYGYSLKFINEVNAVAMDYAQWYAEAVQATYPKCSCTEEMFRYFVEYRQEVGSNEEL